MEPLYILTTVTALTLTLGAIGPRRLRPLGRWHVALRAGLAAMFTFTGIAHFGAFGMRDDLIAMVPAALPTPELLITITGVLELAGALGLLLTTTAHWAAAGLTLLLVGMFPANVHKALNDPTLRLSQELGPRTALQVIFLSATLAVVGHYWSTGRRQARATRTSSWQPTTTNPLALRQPADQNAATPSARTHAFLSYDGRGSGRGCGSGFGHCGTGGTTAAARMSGLGSDGGTSFRRPLTAPPGGRCDLTASTYPSGVESQP